MTARQVPPSLMCSVADAAALMGVSDQTVRNKIDRGEFADIATVRKVGTRILINRDQLEAWLRGEDTAVA